MTNETDLLEHAIAKCTEAERLVKGVRQRLSASPEFGVLTEACDSLAAAKENLLVLKQQQSKP
ncbi:MAG: hypothetical protein QM756_10545 [Polyangiaceae bacterium]